MSLQNIKNRRGPRHEPCAVPYSILYFSEEVILVMDVC